MSMFEVSAIVEGKRLERLLVAMDGLVHNLQVRPVRNATVRGGEVKAITQTGTTYEMLLKHIRDRNLTEISTREMNDMVMARGLSKSAYTIPLARLQEEKILKKGPLTNIGGRAARVYKVIG